MENNNQKLKKMNIRLQIKGLILTVCCFAYSSNGIAQEKISFTWKGRSFDTFNHFGITAAYAERFIIDWGDGTPIEMRTGTGDLEYIIHSYFDTNNYTVSIRGTTANCFFRNLNLSNCQVSNLNISESRALQYLFCNDNQLSNLDVSTNKALRGLNCYNNRLSVLDLHTNTALEWVNCYNNWLSVLDIRANRRLESLFCFSNRLTNLYLGANTALRDLACSGNSLTYLNTSGCKALRWLDCSHNELFALYIGANVPLESLFCDNNHLQLSNLYDISAEINNKNGKYFGQQILPKQALKIGSSVNFSVQKEFGGIATVFTIEKEGLPALASDYAINDGIITFYQRGIYTVIMTNSAIVASYPAQVIVEFNVGNVGIADAVQEIAEVKIYPNPTTGKITIRNEKLGMSSEIEVFDAVGQVVGTWYTTPEQSEMEIDISHLSAGLYFLKIDGKTVKVVKQ